MAGTILHGAPLKIKIEPQTIGQYFFNQAEKYSEHICQIDGVTGKSESFGSVKLRSVRVAIELKKRGLTSEDYVIFCSKNTLDSTIPWLATTFLAAKISSLDPTLSVRDAKHLTELVKPKVIFVEESSLPLIETSLEGTGISTEVVVLGRSSKYSTLDEFLRPTSDESMFKPTQVDPSDVGIVFFSSGTTGLPKGICWSHHNIVQVYQTLLETNIDCSAVLHFTTLYWVSAVAVLICSFSVGGYRVLIPQVDAETTFKAIENLKITFIFASPTIINEIADLKDACKYNTRSLQTVLVGGCKVPPKRLENARKVLGCTNVAETYGMTEVGWISSCSILEDDMIGKKSGSCGKAAPGISIKVVDLESNQIVGPNQKGEVRLRSQCLMQGYLHKDSSDAFDEEGYVKSGDVGYYDEDECLYIVDRIKEMFKYKSWHIVPSSLESILLQHPDVSEAVVYGIPHEEYGDIPAACVVLKKNSSLSGKDIEQYFNCRVLERERLTGGVKILDDLPKTPSGKVLRKEIRNSITKCS